MMSSDKSDIRKMTEISDLRKKAVSMKPWLAGLFMGASVILFLASVWFLFDHIAAECHRTVQCPKGADVHQIGLLCYCTVPPLKG